MFLHILQKDLTKRKATNLIVLLFVILAAMFVGSGLTNVLTVMNGTDYYLEKGGVGDYVIVTLRENALGALDKMLAEEPSIQAYRLDDVVYGSQNGLHKLDGSKIDIKNTPMMQCYSDSTFHFFNENNETPAPLSPGHCYVTGSFLSKNNLKPGDSIRIRQEDVEVTLIIDGKVKDALFGSDFMGNTRFLMHEDDFKKFTENETIRRMYSGQVCCIDTVDHDTKGVEDAVTRCTNIGFNKPRSIISMCYVMDMIVAFVVLILSICLIVLAFVVLKVSLSFTITKEFREIGVLKAIGIKNMKIRTLYLIKYLVIAVAGSLIGFFLSIPFSNLLLKSVSDNMVLGNDLGIIVNVIGAVIVVISIVLMAFFSTRKIKKATPVDAIRTGQTGERFSKKSKLRLSRQNMGNSAFLAVNDTISNPKRYVAIVLAFCLCTLFVLMLVNTTNTMQSASLISTFGAKADLYMECMEDSMKMLALDDEGKDEFFAEKEKLLSDLGMPGKLAVDLQYGYSVTANGKTSKIICEHGYDTDYDTYVFTEGTRPQNRNEIAVTKQIAKALGVSIGDKVTIDFGSEKLDCVITAYYQSFNQVGEVIRLHPDAPVDHHYTSSAMAFQVTFDDHPSDEVILERKAILEKELDEYKVFTAAGYVAECIGVVSTMQTVQYLLLAITLVVVSLITILMELSFLADEKSQIALLKAIGFKNRKIYSWHVIRFGIVAAIACILAGTLSIPMTKLCITPIFGMMGVSKITYAFKPLQLFLIYPAAILVVTLIVAYLTSLSSKSIHSYDTANIE